MQKLYDLLERAVLEMVTPETLERQKEILALCRQFRCVRNAPLHFRVYSGHENLSFCAQACIDIVYLNGKPPLHIVDEATRFSATCFLTKMSTESVWEGFVQCWFSVYTGLADNIMVDEDSQFRKTFAELAALHDVNLQKTLVYSQNSRRID